MLNVNVHAVTLWDQTLDQSLSGAFSNYEMGGSYQQVADDFVLTAQGAIDNISWAGYYDSPQALSNPVDFKLRFFNDAGIAFAIPADSFFQEYDVTVNAIPTGHTGVDPVGSGSVFSYTAGIPPLMLDAGTYWISIIEADARTPVQNSNQWLWSRSDPLGVGGYANRAADLETWSAAILEGNMALTLGGTTVPMLPTLWSFGSGMLGIIGMASSRTAA